MSSGYVRVVDRGGTFEEFFWDCARNRFGANAEPDEVAPGSDYRRELAEKLATEEGRLVSLQAFAQEDVERICAVYNLAAHALWTEAVASESVTRYRLMIEKTQSWQPPTPGHMELKDFMLSQLAESLKVAEAKVVRPIEETPSAWLAREVSRCEDDIKRLREEVEKSQRRADGHEAWSAALRASVPPPT